jgi:hypothetical protein
MEERDLEIRINLTRGVSLIINWKKLNILVIKEKIRR